MIGQTLDHYRIVAQLGEGGMGVVYRARDEVLNRDVALKLLGHGALDKVGSDHLLREAQTASSLSHPNICTIHQVGRTGDEF
jgi:serine/threonine protein kinase